MENLSRFSIEKVVLVNPPMRLEQVYGSFSEWGSISPPTGLCYIAALLRKKGYGVSIIDAEALGLGVEETVQAVLERRPQIVGIACKTLWIVSAHRIARALKDKIPEVPIVAGGNHVTALPERTLREFPFFDMLVIGEGEITFLDLIDALNEGRDLTNVAGLGFWNKEKICLTLPRKRIRNLDELPFPAWDLLPEITSHYRPPLVSESCRYNK